MSYIIGMDGGGTNTSVVLIREGHEALRLRIGGINYNSFPAEQIKGEFRRLAGKLRELGFAWEECEGIGVGAAGISNPEAVPFLEVALWEAGFFCPVRIVGDQEAALIGGLGKQAGLLLVAGTGSICLAQSAGGERVRVGGCGHLIDDEGSAYAVGRDMLAAVVRAQDGREEATALTEEIFGQLGIQSVPELIAFVYSGQTGKKEIAALAAGLTEELTEGDGAARRIAEKAARELYVLVETAFRQLETTNTCSGEAVPLLLQGSVARKNAAIRTRFLARIQEAGLPLKCEEMKRDAAYGAASLFLENVGWQLT